LQLTWLGLLETDYCYEYLNNKLSLTDQSGYSNALARWDDTTTFDFHRLQAIKAINERLNVEGKSPNIPISDGITMAVALLVNNEVSEDTIARVTPQALTGACRRLLALSKQQRLT
jgi:hypothetical protein